MDAQKKMSGLTGHRNMNAKDLLMWLQFHVQDNIKHLPLYFLNEF